MRLGRNEVIARYPVPVGQPNRGVLPQQGPPFLSLSPIDVGSRQKVHRFFFRVGAAKRIDAVAGRPIPGKSPRFPGVVRPGRQRVPFGHHKVGRAPRGRGDLFAAPLRWCRGFAAAEAACLASQRACQGFIRASPRKQPPLGLSWKLATPSTKGYDVGVFPFLRRRFSGKVGRCLR